MRRALFLFCPLAVYAADFSESPLAIELSPVTVSAEAPPWYFRTRTATTSLVLPESPALTSAVEVFRSLPGIQIDQPGGPGGRSSFYIRGAEANYGLVLLDGVPLNDPTDSRGGGVDLPLLGHTKIESVEIIKGPPSARFGPEALSGVVRISTISDAADQPPTLSIAAGGHADAEATATAGFRTPGFHATLEANAQQDGESAEGGVSKSRGAMISFGQTLLGGKFDAHLRTNTETEQSFPDDSGGERLAQRRTLEELKQDQTTFAAAWSSAGADDQHGTRVQIDSAWTETTSHSPGVAPGLRDSAGLPSSNEDTHFRSHGASLEAAATFGEVLFAVGADLRAEVGRSEAKLFYGPLVLPNSWALARNRYGVFTEVTWTALDGKLLIQPSGRIDKYSDADARFTPRLGFRWKFSSETTWRANLGMAEKQPSFYALSNPLVGNPHLKPEKGQSADLGFEHTWRTTGFSVESSVFTSRYKDGIDFDPGPPPQLINRSAIRTRGADVALSWKSAATFSTSAYVTYVDARSDPDNQRLLGRPPWQGGFRGSWAVRPEIILRSTLTIVGQKDDSSIPTGNVTLGSWTRLDLSAEWQLAKNRSLWIAIDNATNTTYEEAIGFTSPNARMRLGVRVGF